jgi:hypothetical protein
MRPYEYGGKLWYKDNVCAYILQIDIYNIYIDRDN